MTTIHTAEDLVRVLREQPELLEAARALILTDELLSLPVRVDQLTVRVDQLTVRVDQLTVRVDQLTARVDQLTAAVEALTQTVREYIERTDQRLARLESDMTEVKSDMTEVKTRVGTLNGWYLEERVRRNLLNVAKDEMGLTRGRILAGVTGEMDPQLRAAIAEAEAQGSITEDELDNLEVADIVIRARRTSDRKYIYAVGEISYTIKDNDIERARDRANTLATVTSDEVIAMVIGGIIQPPQRALADLNNVQVVIPAMLEQEP